MKMYFIFPACFTQELLNGAYNHTEAVPQEALYFMDPTSCEGEDVCNTGEVTPLSYKSWEGYEVTATPINEAFLGKVRHQR